MVQNSRCPEHWEHSRQHNSYTIRPCKAFSSAVLHKWGEISSCRNHTNGPSVVIEELLVDPTRSICKWCYFVIAGWGLLSLTWNWHNCLDEGAMALLVLYAPPSGNFPPFPLVTHRRIYFVYCWEWSVCHRVTVRKAELAITRQKWEWGKK